MTDFLDLDDVGLADAYSRWEHAKLAADEAAEVLKAADDVFRTALRDAAPKGATLIIDGRRAAAWTLKQTTTVDVARLATDHQDVFLACAKPAAVDLAKLRRDYPQLVAAYSVTADGSFELRLATS